MRLNADASRAHKGWVSEGRHTSTVSTNQRASVPGWGHHPPPNKDSLNQKAFIVFGREEKGSFPKHARVEVWSQEITSWPQDELKPVSETLKSGYQKDSHESRGYATSRETCLFIFLMKKTCVQF